MMNDHLAPDRSLTPTLSQRAMARTCCADFAVIGLAAGLMAASPTAADTTGAAMPLGESAPSSASYPAAPNRLTPDRIHRDLSWDYCGPRPPSLGPLPPSVAPSDDTLITLDADAADYDQERDLVTVRGRIEAQRGTQRVETEELIYDRSTGEMTATGRAFVQHPGLRILSERAELNLEQEQGTLWGTGYRLMGESNARGTAQRADILSSDLTRYRDITYSTCPPGRNDWSLRATELDIDQEAGRGIARHARLRVGRIPVLYSPYLSFPIDSRRKSGFLVPSIGSSSETGFDVTVPYYFNIAPALDATFLPRYMSERGLMLGGELRYLTPRQRGLLFGEILPRDQGEDDRRTRGALHVEQSGQFASRWSTALNLNQVSDSRYLEDFGNRLELTSIRNIERRGDLYYSGDGWGLLTRLQGFQTVDDGLPAASRPYDRLPQVRLDVTPWRFPTGLELGGEAEYVLFDHSAIVDGHRLAAAPYLRWPLRRSYGHLIPEVRFYGAGYSLSDQAPGASASPSYAIPSASLDGQLVFERGIAWLGRPALQTLEPRLFYLYTAYEDQQDQPIFDTTELSFSFFSLFRDNRFTGRDRIGDANRLTIGLTSRTLAERTGDELLRISLGQILYVDDPRVAISGEAEADDADASAIAGELSARLFADWSARASFQWDPDSQDDEDAWEKRVLQLRYEAGPERLINASYRFDLGDSPSTRYEDTDLSFRWPLGRQVDMVGRWLYSMQHDETMEAFAGVEYGRCCWRLSLVGRHFKNSPEGSGNTSVMLQLELAGLGSLGHRIDTFLERSIYGYHAE